MSKVTATAREPGITKDRDITRPAAGVLADPDVRDKVRAALAGGHTPVEVAGAVGASVAEVQRLAAGWRVCPPWCVNHYTGHGDLLDLGDDVHAGVTYTLGGVSTCRGGADDDLSVYLDRLDRFNAPAGTPVVWLSSDESGQCWRLSPGQALPLAAMLILAARRGLGGGLRRRAAKRRTGVEAVGGAALPVAPAEPDAITYRGRTRSGTPCVGRTVVDNLRAWVEARYHAGWREMTVTAADSGTEVGGIGRHLDTGRRTWWAATSGRAVASS